MKNIEKSDIWLTVAIGVLGWVLVTLYGLNGRVSTQSAQITSINNQLANVQTTTNSIYDFMLGKSIKGFNNASMTMAN